MLFQWVSANGQILGTDFSFKQQTVILQTLEEVKSFSYQLIQVLQRGGLTELSADSSLTERWARRAVG